MAKKKGSATHRLAALHQRWGVVTSGESDFAAFKVRLKQMLDYGHFGTKFHADGSDFAFSLIAGESYSPMVGLGLTYRLQIAPTLPTFMVTLQQALWAMEQTKSKYTEEFLTAIQEAKELSPGIDFVYTIRAGRVTFYPPGARELDRPLVEETLTWLSGHRDVAEHFEEALKILLERDAPKYRNVLDNLRWALEQLLRALLGNRKPLEKQREFLLPWLSDRGVHKQVINMYSDLLNRFAEYQNDAVKHGANWSSVELEFIVYLTGAFMRLVLSLQDAPVQSSK